MPVSKKIVIFLILISFLIAGFSFAQRELEITYPALPGVETPTTTKTTLPSYLRYIFTLAIMIAGILAFLAMVLGGIKYLTSAGSPAAMSDAKDQITSGVLGVIILLASFLILNTINPQLIMPKRPPIAPAIAGIRIYSNSNDCGQNTINPDQEINSMVINQTIKKLKDPDRGLDWGTIGIYKIESIKFYSESENLAVKVYEGDELSGGFRCYGKEANCSGAIEQIDYEQGDCKNFPNVIHKSLKLDWYIPGVYLYATDNCTEDSRIYQSSSATLPGFNDQTRSIKFISGEFDASLNKYQLRYSAVLHEHENFLGEAAVFDINRVGNETCFRIYAGAAYPGQPSLEGRASSITVYLKPKYRTNGSEIIVGQGVRLYEHKNYNMADESAGCTSKKPPQVFGDDESVGNVDTLNYCTDNCDAGCNDKFTSMEMDGYYLALLCENTAFGGKCEVFTSSDPNFRDNSIGQCGFLGRGDCLSSFIIKARK